MRTDRPKIQRVYVTVMDADTRKSESQTVYHATREEVMEVIQRALAGSTEKPRRKRTADPAAA